MKFDYVAAHFSNKSSVINIMLTYEESELYVIPLFSKVTLIFIVPQAFVSPPIIDFLLKICLVPHCI